MGKPAVPSRAWLFFGRLRSSPIESGNFSLVGHTVTVLPQLRRIPLTARRTPLVSICVTSFNQARYIDAALQSALDQTYEPLEVVVVDDASTDDTAARVRAHDDARIRFQANKRRLGQSGNRNRALELTRGELIKFLDGDDLLEPDCVTKMTQLMVDDPAVGLVFSRWRIAVAEWPEAKPSLTAQCDEGQTHFRALGTRNDGRALLAEWLSSGLLGNWIGPPSAVMVRRGHVEASGGFGHYVQQTIDADLWARVFARALIGFVDEPLAIYTVHDASLSTALGRTRRSWLDRLWTLEALARDPEVRRAYPALTDLLPSERRMVHRSALRLGHIRRARRVPLRPYLRYMAFRMMAERGRKAELFPALPPVVDAAQPGDG
jgi:glycosyltransferase involved in cell wall biosynthesis